jgi:hypothetical protein
MNPEILRNELKRTLRQAPFRPFILTFRGGERAVVEHPENIAFDPRPGATTEFYLLTGSLRMFSSFESISSITMLSDVGGPQQEQVQTS